MDTYLKKIIRSILSGALKKEDEPCNLFERACHYNELFIRHDGVVFPCCLVWTRNDMRIGHIDDHSIIEKIQNYYHKCSCEKYQLRKALSGENISCEFLHLELSLSCQGKCVMCCVKAPDWRGSFHGYERLIQLVELLKPKEIRVQGGEVLIQKESIKWLYHVKERFPGTSFSIVTNANVRIDMVDTVNELFDLVIFSMVGFQPSTYSAIMSMDVRKTISFIEALAASGTVKLWPKYLVTPLNIHESCLFLDWAVGLKPSRIRIDSSGICRYLNLDTDDKYWEKIIARSENAVKEVLLRRATDLRLNHTVVGFDAELTRMFHLTKEFVGVNGLGDVCVHNLLAGGNP